MGIIVTLVGGFGAVLAFVGALTALFAGGIGFSTGVADAESFTVRAIGGLFASFIGVAGALTARSRLRLGASFLIASAVIGLFLTFWFYLAGAVMLLASATMALWPSSESAEGI